MRTVFFLVRKEFLQIFRDRTTVFQIFMIPVVQLLVLANAATFDVKRVAMLVVDEDRTTVSTGLVQRLMAGRQFRVVRYEASDADVDHALLDREVTAVLHIPRHFEEDLVRRRSRAGPAGAQRRGGGHGGHRPVLRQRHPRVVRRGAGPDAAHGRGVRGSRQGVVRSTSGRSAGTTRPGTTSTGWCRR